MKFSKPSPMIQQFEKWSIGKKIFLGNLLFLIAPLLVIFALILHYTFARLNTNIENGMQAAGSSIANMIEMSIDSSIYNYLRAIAEKNLQIAESYHQKQLNGTLSESQAKQAVTHIFRPQIIGRSGYIYCIDSQGVPQFHPEKELEGKNVLHLAEYMHAWPFLQEQIARKTGYLEYEWKNPGEKIPRTKALYMAYFPPWDWIISATCYRDEFKSIIDLKALEARIQAFKYGRSGYAFICDEKGEVLVHPYLNNSEKNEYTTQVKALLEAAAASESHTIEYLWKNPGERDAREKILFYKKIPQFGLIVGVTAYKAEAYAGLLFTRIIVALVVLTGALLSICAAFFMSRLFAAPLRQFALQLEVSQQDGAVEYNGGCEITFLMTRFNQYLETLRNSNAKLNAEVQFRKSAETFLQIYKKIFDSATEGILITDATGKILAVNDAFTAITGYEAYEAIGQDPRMLKSDHHDPEFFKQMWHSLNGTGTWEGEVWNRKKDGTIFPEWLTINSIRDERKKILYYFAMFYEIGELKKREKQVAFMAYHDILTRLPNRSYLENKLAKAIARIKVEGGRMTVFFIDLDNFKNINDVFGHHQGDDLLVQVTQRFTSVLGDNDTLCRLGSDEFILLMENIDNESVIYLMANRILAVLKKPFLLDFKKIYVNASIGIASYPGDGGTGMDLIRGADMAMHKAKRDGKNRFFLFTKGMHEELYEKFRTENGIRYGLLHREFIVHYQPKVNIETRKTSSLEALIRWEKGGRLIGPNTFIPIAEESSLIDDICMFVMEETCAFHALMKKQQVEVPISVNISPRQFHNADFVDIVEDLLNRYQVEPRFIEFEITETTAMKDVEHTLAIMHRIRQLGILFSIDDFGTGYSSLGYLNKMPVSTLKIDKQFVDDLKENSAIVATIIAISEQMHLNVVAEGVETEEQLLSLGAMGCHEAQGYYFSRPVSGDHILQYLLSERAQS